MSSCLTISPLPRTKREAVYFLWHFPWDHSRFPLETALPCGAGLSSAASGRSDRNATGRPRRDGRLSGFRFSKGYSTRGGRFRLAVFRAPDCLARPVCPPTVRRRFTGRFRREILN